ncbi:MAG: PD40 domain-containing protein [Gemmatimonadetes bacterium]|nr:PD40 domain-containing protein [Gemmatimonadota bacterium]
MTLQVGQRQGVVATAYDARSNVLPSVRITWSSTNLAVARVDPDTRQPGVATIIGVAPGIALIEAEAGGRKGTVQVQVGGAGGVAPPVTQPGAVASTAVALRVDPNSVYLLPSEDARLSVSFLQADGSAAAAMPVTWRSLSETVASIGPDGTLVGISPGQGVVEARTATGLVARATVFVATAPFAFGVDALSLAPGEQDTVPVVVPSQGNRRVATRGLTWTSTNPAVATVTPLGIAVGVSAGQGEIIASGFGQTARLPVVVHRAVETMGVNPAQGMLTVPVSGTVAVGADAYAADGSPIPEAPFTWRVADTTVAGYDSGTKLLRGKRIGRTRLTVQGPGRGLEASWTVDVVAGGLGLTPGRLGLIPGERKSVSASFVGTIQGAALGYARVVGTTAWGKADTVDVYVQAEIVVTSTRRGNVPTLYAFDRASPSRFTALTQDTTAAQTDPAPSPDGSRIAYVTDRDGNAEIYVMNADGSNPRRLTNTAAAEGSPAWTPDGSRIVYASNAADGTTATFHIWMLNADGSSPRQLTQGAHSNFQPAVSPDGGTVAFTTDRDGNYNIYLMGIDGSNQRQFTRAPAPETNSVWLADGQLAYLLQEPGRTLTSRVMRATVSTGEAVPISPQGLAVSDFDVSKAGDLMALVVTQFGRGGSVSQKLYLWALNAAGAVPTEVPPARSQDRLTSPAFRK